MKNRIVYFQLVVTCLFWTSNAFAADYFWKIDARDSKTKDPIEGVTVTGSFTDVEANKTSVTTCQTDVSGTCTLISEVSRNLFSSSRIEGRVTPIKSGYSKEFKQGTAKNGDFKSTVYFLLTKETEIRETNEIAARETQLGEAQALEAKRLLEENATKAKKESEELAARKSSHEAQKIAKAGVSLFGMVLGLSTIDDVRELVTVKDANMCKSLSSYRYCGFESEYSGSLSSPDNYASVRYLNPRFASITSLIEKNDYQDPNLTNISFAKFVVDGNFFSGIFLENVLIELKVISEYGGDEIERELASELRASFNKKYKKAKSITKTSSGDYARTTTLYETWNEPSDAFSVQLKQEKSVVTNINLCYEWVKILKRSGAGTAKLEASCHPAMNNVPEYTLTYRYDSAYSKALALLVDMDRNRKAAGDNAKKKNISKF